MNKQACTCNQQSCMHNCRYWSVQQEINHSNKLACFSDRHSTQQYLVHVPMNLMYSFNFNELKNHIWRKAIEHVGFIECTLYRSRGEWAAGRCVIIHIQIELYTARQLVKACRVTHSLRCPWEWNTQTRWLCWKIERLNNFTT